MTDTTESTESPGRTELTEMGEVTWSPVADTYLPSDRRAAFLAEAAQSRWRPAKGSFPMSQGLGLRIAVKELMDLGLRGIDEVAYSQSWVMREGSYRAPEPGDDPDLLMDATILGVRSTVNDLTFYLLDMGVGIAPIAHLDTRTATPSGATPRPDAMEADAS